MSRTIQKTLGKRAFSSWGPVGSRKVSEQIMVSITAVTSVTKIRCYPSRLTP
jgi:hypothetical protein